MTTQPSNTAISAATATSAKKSVKTAYTSKFTARRPIEEIKDPLIETPQAKKIKIEKFSSPA